MGLYTAAAAVLAGVESRQSSLKNLVYSSNFQVVGPGAGRRAWGAGSGRAGVGGEARLGYSMSPPSLAEREAVVRAGVRDAALLGRAGRRDRQCRAPARREEAAATPGQGEQLLGPVAYAWLCTSLWDPNGAGTDVTSPGALRDELNRTETQASGGRCYLAGKGDDGKEGWGLQSSAEQVASWGRRTGM